MVCPKCGAEHDANFCPQCGTAADGSTMGQTVIINNPPSKKKKSAVPKIIGGVLIALGLIGIFGSGGEDKPKPVSNSPHSNTAQSSKPEGPQKFGVGQSAEYSNITVTLNGVSSNAGTQFLSPADGNVFVLCDFTFENNSDKEMAISSMLSFDAYADGYALNFSLGALTAKPDNVQQLDGTVAPGKKMRGVVGYEVPKSWSEFEIGVQLGASSGAKIIFVAQNQ